MEPKFQFFNFNFEEIAALQYTTLLVAMAYCCAFKRVLTAVLIVRPQNREGLGQSPLASVGGTSAYMRGAQAPPPDKAYVGLLSAILLRWAPDVDAGCDPHHSSATYGSSVPRYFHGDRPLRMC